MALIGHGDCWNIFIDVKETKTQDGVQKEEISQANLIVDGGFQNTVSFVQVSGFANCESC